MTDCTRNCPPDCFDQKLKMRDRIEELEKQVPHWINGRTFKPEHQYCVRVNIDSGFMLVIDKPFPAHPNQSIGEQERENV